MLGIADHCERSDFRTELPASGKLGGLDVGTKTIGLAICDAGWHFAGPVETIRRTKFTQDLTTLREFICVRTFVVLSLVSVEHGRHRQPPNTIGPSLREKPGAAELPYCFGTNAGLPKPLSAR